MTNIDDSNDTQPGYWFGELNGRLRDRMRDELRDLDLGRRGWRILHSLAENPATADDLAASLPRHGRRSRPDLPGRGDPANGSAAQPERREWRGRPDWMRREWERRQEMYRAWMEHDRERSHPDSRGEHEHPEHHEHHEHDEHEHHEDLHEHEHHHHHAGGRDSQQAFERGFERGFVRGFERGVPGGPGRFGPRPFAPGSGAGRFGHGPQGQAYGYGPAYAPGHGHGHGHATSPGRGCRDHLRDGIDRILADFVERGWVWFDGDTATLTDEGRAAHDAAFERIRSLRNAVSEGIDPADLATTMATLEAMARNLGWAPPAEDADASGSSAGESRSDGPASD